MSGVMMKYNEKFTWSK